MARKLSKEAAIEQLWRKHVVCQVKLDNKQLEMVNMIQDKNEKVFVFNFARRRGKSYAAVALAIELCLKHPKYKVNYVTSTAVMLKDIVYPLMETILEDCPNDMKPQIKKNENSIIFQNGSAIRLSGTDNQRADRLRGIASNLCIIDEAGFMSDLSKVVDEILLPTTLTTNGKIVIISTPPETMDHAFFKYLNRAKFQGTFLLSTIYDNPRLTKEQISQMADATGGVDSVSFQREYMCINKPDQNKMVVPEFSDEYKALCIKINNKPDYFHSYVSMDPGFTDGTAVVFGYHDFKLNSIVIEDEIFIQGNKVVTDLLASQIKALEYTLWRTGSGVSVTTTRVSDTNNGILLNDLLIKHNLLFTPTAKDNFKVALNSLRMLISSKRLIINPRCVQLLSHIENAQWNKSGDSFARNDGHHYDLLAALIYLIRNVNENLNPFPSDYIDYNTHITTPSYRDPNKKDEESFRNILIPQKIKIRRRF